MQISGAILIDKPPLITSYDVIREIKKILPGTKIGHTGTLDPIGTGLMILLAGTATKLAGYFLKLSKVYSFTVRFGQETDTMDSTGNIIKEYDCTNVTERVLKETLRSFEGRIEQYPPMYSAVKYKGRPLYKYARKGLEVTVAPRMVNIKNISMEKFSLPYAIFTADVSSGTYIRSLAKSIGDVIGCGAHVTALRRISIGDFNIGQAYQLADIKQYLQQNPVNCKVIINNDILLSNIKQYKFLDGFSEN